MIAGVIAGLISAGCNQPGGDYKTAQQIKQEKQAAGQAEPDHAHDDSEGPHGGSIVELGDDEYHAEVMVDGKTHSLTVYLYGPDAKTVSPIAAEEIAVVTEDDTKLALKAAPQEGDAEGKSSKFILTDEAAVGPIAEAGFLHGSLQVEIDGKPYRGDIDSHFDGSSHEDHADQKAGDQKEGPKEPEDAEEKSTDDSADKSEK
jgi:hypothetical protein